MVSDGYQQQTLASVTAGYTVNGDPTVDAGLNKPISGAVDITPEVSLKPFIDCIVIDNDVAPYNVASLDYKIDSGSWISIPLGAFNSFQEAARALTIAAGTLSVGSYTLSLRATDGGTPALSTTDTLTVTVVSDISSDISDIKSAVDSYLDAAVSSRATSSEVSIIDTNVDGIKTKTDSYLDATVSSRATQTSVDNITVDTGAIADAVWDEQQEGHTTDGSFGYRLWPPDRTPVDPPDPSELLLWRRKTPGFIVVRDVTYTKGDTFYATLEEIDGIDPQRTAIELVE